MDIREQNYTGIGILKISLDSQVDEAERNGTAFADNSAFAKQHFPKVLKKHQSESCQALLMTVAGQGLLFTDQLSLDIPQDKLILALQNVTDGILRHWNNHAVTGSEVKSSYDIIKHWLGDRLTTRDRITQFIETNLGASAEDTSFLVGGQALMNPLKAVKSPLFLGSSFFLLPVTGLVHGDLHGGNVLVHRQIPKNFYLIDFASYQGSSPLLFDLSYLELSLLIAGRRLASASRLRDLVASLRNIEDPRDVTKFVKSADDEGLLRAVAQIRARTNSWIEAKFPQRSEDLRKQLLLSRIAAGLNFANKSSLDDDFEQI